MADTSILASAKLAAQSSPYIEYIDSVTDTQFLKLTHLKKLSNV